MEANNKIRPVQTTSAADTNDTESVSEMLDGISPVHPMLNVPQEKEKTVTDGKRGHNKKRGSERLKKEVDQLDEDRKNELAPKKPRAKKPKVTATSTQKPPESNQLLTKMDEIISQLSLMSSGSGNEHQGESGSTSIGWQLTEPLRTRNNSQLVMASQLFAELLEERKRIEKAANDIDDKLSNDKDLELEREFENMQLEVINENRRNAASVKNMQLLENTIQKKEIERGKNENAVKKIDEDSVEKQRKIEEMVARMMPFVRAIPQATQNNE